MLFGRLRTFSIFYHIWPSDHKQVQGQWYRCCDQLTRSHHSQLCACLPQLHGHAGSLKLSTVEVCIYISYISKTPQKKVIFSRKWAVQYVPAHHCCSQKMTWHPTQWNKEQNSGWESKDGILHSQRTTCKYLRTSLRLIGQRFQLINFHILHKGAVTILQPCSIHILPRNTYKINLYQREKNCILEI